MDADETIQVMKSSRQRWTTLRGHGRDWHHSARHRAAFTRDRPADAEIGIAVSYAHRSDRPDRSEEEESDWRLWIALPDKIRLEFPVGIETLTAVFHGPIWWSMSPHMGARTNEGEPDVRHGTGPGYPLTDPARLASALDLVVRDTANIAGREALLMTGTPRRGSGGLLNQLAEEEALDDLGGSGADEFEVAVDVERGVILRAEARLEAQPFHVIKFIEVEFDEPLPADTFSMNLPPGTTFQSSVPRWWLDRRL
jgi:outer membrane lipoprotein-sorting protein